MRRLLEGISRNSFLAMGRAGMDLYADPPGVRVEDATAFACGLGGSAGNIAVGLVKFGGRAEMLTSVSDDPVGGYALRQLDQYGVGRRHVRAVGGQTRTSLAVYESAGPDSRTVIYRNDAADFQMTVDDVDAVDWSAVGVLVTAGTVFAAEPSRSAAFHAFERAKAAGVTIVFDIDYRPYSWPSPDVAADVLSRAGAASDAVIGNDEEFGFMAGRYEDGLAHARGLAQNGLELVIYKRGANGAVTFAEGRELRTGIYRVDAVKPNGAGDSFAAGLLSGLREGLDLRAAVMRGSACAAIVVSQPGCAPSLPDHAALDAFLARHPGPTDPVDF